MITSLVKATAKTTVGVTVSAVRILSRPGLWLTRRVTEVAFPSPDRPPESRSTASSGKTTTAKPRSAAKPRSGTARKRAAREPGSSSSKTAARARSQARTRERPQPTHPARAGEPPHEAEPTHEGRAVEPPHEAAPSKPSPDAPATMSPGPATSGIPGRDAPPTPPAEPHHALNTPVGEPDPTEWPDPYDQRADPRDPDSDEPIPLGDVSHTPTGARSTSEPHPDQDPEAVGSEPPERDKLDE